MKNKLDFPKHDCRIQASEIAEYIALANIMNDIMNNEDK